MINMKQINAYPSAELFKGINVFVSNYFSTHIEQLIKSLSHES